MLDFVQTSADTMLAEALAHVEDVFDEVLSPADPRRQFIEALVFIQSTTSVRFNDAANQNLIAFAAGSHLTKLAALTGTIRKGAEPATCVVRFHRPSPTSLPVLIPEGTRVGADVSFLFFTKREDEIPSGESFVDVLVEAEAAGSKGNDFALGQIAFLADAVAGVSSIENVSVSAGGLDEESDDALRARQAEELSLYNAGGTAGYYRRHALRSDATVLDVSIRSSAPGIVDVVVLPALGADSETVVGLVARYLDDPIRRALTDSVLVTAPKSSFFQPSFSYWLYETERPFEATRKAEVEAAVADFVAWQTSALGRDLDPDRLRAAVLSVDGVKRLSPSVGFTFLAVDLTTVATLSSPSIVTLAGFEVP